MDPGESAYEILGIPEDATDKQIKKAYHRKCLEWHPDRGTGKEEDTRRRTVMTCKINDAKEILLDPVKRREHDEDLTYTRNTGEPRGRADMGGGPGNAYQRDIGRQRPSSDGLGRPYPGDVTPRNFTFDGDGIRGKDAMDGSPGHNGYAYGMDGTGGTSASAAVNGTPALDIKIFLRTMITTDGEIYEVDVWFVRSQTEVMNLNDGNSRTFALKEFGSLDWHARGGDGGHGGRGGRGGRGASGYPGQDATESRPGTNGGPGGDGGDGGYGSSGGDGGRGGDAEVIIERDDEYLLLRVDGLHPRDGCGTRVKGGTGGKAGQHGRGGAGGAGGRGGNSCSWTTYHSYTDSSGLLQTRTEYHRSPGGWRGRSGRRGFTPNTPLYEGTDGKDGSLRIRVTFPDNVVKVFPARYDLAFKSTTTEQLSDMVADKTYEFGEAVTITSLLV